MKLTEWHGKQLVRVFGLLSADYLRSETEEENVGLDWIGLLDADGDDAYGDLKLEEDDDADGDEEDHVDAAAMRRITLMRAAMRRDEQASYCRPGVMSQQLFQSRHKMLLVALRVKRRRTVRCSSH